jgi:phosphoglycerol transferase MdoB-like AlkP superfamily enzyme
MNKFFGFFDSIPIVLWLASLVIALSAALIFHVICIWIFGDFHIREPNLAILLVETIGLVAIFVFGFVELVMWSKR